MRKSRGMGCINEKKIPGYKKGGRPRLQPEVNRVIGIDRLSKAERATHKLGKQKPNLNNFGSLSKFK